MLDFFTDPYPNELLYSSIARYHYYVGNYVDKDTYFEIYGVNKVSKSSILFGSNLDHLVKKLGGTYSVEELIFNHTLLPVYKPFISEDDYVQMINSIRKGGSISNNSNFLNKRICKKDRLYYCSKCAIEDAEKYGEAYFHREHQIEGILVCHRHILLLKQYYSYWANGKKSNGIIKLDKRKVDLKDKMLFTDEAFFKLSKISELSYKLFSKDTKLINKQKLCEYYKNILYTKGFAYYSGEIKQKILKEEIINYYGIELLDMLQSEINMDAKLSWTDLLFENRTFTHPIRHMLLINFLDINIDDINSDIDTKYTPYGNGPWPCMNKFCEFYKQDVIRNIIIKTDGNHNKEIGIFKCEICGLKYSRFLSIENDDNYNIRKVLDYGKLWIETLEKHLKDGDYSINELSKIMGCSYNVIYNNKHIDIKKYKDVNKIDKGKLDKSKKTLLKALELNPLMIRKDFLKLYPKEFQYINHFEPVWLKSLPSQNNRYKNDNEKLEIWKNEVLKIMEINPNITRTQLIRKINNRCTFIINNDLNWWEENVQARKSSKIGKTVKIDWKKRDAELLKLLKEKYIEIYNQKEVVKITKSLLNREIDIFTMSEEYVKKMPESKTYTEYILDTPKSFRMRGYKRYIDEKIKDDINFTAIDIPKSYMYFNKKDKNVIEELENYMETIKIKIKME